MCKNCPDARTEPPHIAQKEPMPSLKAHAPRGGRFSPVGPDATEGILCGLVASVKLGFLQAFTREILFREPAETDATSAFMSLET